MRMATPRSSASWNAAATTGAIAAPRWKSYCARSRVRCAPRMKSAIQPATGSDVWPPCVRERTSMAEADFVSRLAGASLGATFNFYRDGRGARERCRRLAAYLEARAGRNLLLVGVAGGYRRGRGAGPAFA